MRKFVGFQIVEYKKTARIFLLLSSIQMLFFSGTDMSHCPDTNNETVQKSGYFVFIRKFLLLL